MPSSGRFGIGTPNATPSSTVGWSSGRASLSFLIGPEKPVLIWARVMTRKRSAEKKKLKETEWIEQDEENDYIERVKKDAGKRRHRANIEDTAPKR